MSDLAVATSRRFARPGGLTPKHLLAWGAAVLLSVYLGLSGGGYDIVVRSELGLVVWWVLLLGALIGWLPRMGSPRSGWIAATLLTGFLAWTWIGLSWTGSHELTLDEVGRVSTYLGVFVLGVAALRLDTARPVIGGLGFGIALVSGLGVLSKLTPGLFGADTASSFYATPRLSYPFDYADGVGEYAALGIPLLLFLATASRTRSGRAAATAGLQLVLLCLAMTVSRGGILAAVAGVIAFYALIPNRISRLATLAITAAGILVLMVALLGRSALRDTVGAAPGGERHSMLAILVVVLIATAAAQAALDVVKGRVTPPAWLEVSRRQARLVAAVIVAGVIAVVLIAFATDTVSHMYRSFKVFTPTAHSNQYFRLFSLAGSHRYQYWQIAWDAFKSSIVHGIGPGTFRFYWDQHTTYREYVLNAHSLWFETLAETGLVGGGLLAGFFAFIVGGGAARALRAGIGHERRLLVATSTAGVIAFCAAASFDWVWQIGVVPMVALLLAAVTVVPPTPASVPGSRAAAGQSAASGPRAYAPLWLALPRRAGLAAGALLAGILITIPLASTVEVRASQADDHRGQLAAALDAADSAQAVEPGAASPYLQRALVLEQEDRIAAAGVAIREAIAREPTNYELWLIASRIATDADHPRAATADFMRFKQLYPTYSPPS